MIALRFLAASPLMAGLVLVLVTAEALPGVPLPSDALSNGTIAGRFVFDGTPPEPKVIDMTKDPDHCQKGPRTDPTWVVGAEGGVANVVVWVRAPQDACFKLADKDRVRKDPVVIRQPHCAFEPHVFAVYPSYYDAETRGQIKTGQILKVINDAPIPHNSSVDFGNPRLNGGMNQLLPARTPERVTEMKFEDLKPGKAGRWGGEESVRITCNIHVWMSARGWIFDHPFFAISRGGAKADKAFGTFKIENVPADIELDLVYWHETMRAPQVLQKVRLDKGKGIKIADVRIK